MNKVTVTKRESVDVYSIRNGGEWGIFMLDESTGLFTAYSTFGNFTHQWTCIGNSTLAEFVSDLDFGYAMGKFKGTGYRIYDHDETVRQNKHHIISNRKHDWIDKDDARTAYNAFDEISYSHDFQEFVESCNDNTDIKDVIIQDNWAYEQLMEGQAYCPQCKAFWNKMFIPFVAYLQPEHKLKEVA